jgi:hypothetical protein
LEDEITLNLAYRWFCGFDLTDRIPDHSLFSQNRKRRFKDDKVFREIFNHVVRLCVESGLVSGDAVSDGTFVPANVAESSFTKISEEVERSSVKYLDALDDELRKEPGYKEPVPAIEEKTSLKSVTDPDCGYIDQERKKGMGYMSEMTVDTKNGIILGVDCFSGERRESSIILKHIEKTETDTGAVINNLGRDAGYDVGAVHRGLELLGVTGYVSCIDFSYDILKREAKYLPELDCFECPAGKRINFVKLTYKKATQNYYRLYRMPTADRKTCQSCERFRECSLSHSAARICASAHYPAFYRNRKRYETSEYKAMKRLRGIWAEGTFAVLKREHNLSKIKKRGLYRAAEECLLSALALNLKRMVKAMDKRLNSCAVIRVFELFRCSLDIYGIRPLYIFA